MRFQNLYRVKCMMFEQSNLAGRYHTQIWKLPFSIPRFWDGPICINTYAIIHVYPIQIRMAQRVRNLNSYQISTVQVWQEIANPTYCRYSIEKSMFSKDHFVSWLWSRSYPFDIRLQYAWKFSPMNIYHSPEPWKTPPHPSTLADE